MSKDAFIPPLPPVEQLVAPGCWMQLTALEVGVATLLLAASWSQGCLLPNDAHALADISRDSSWLHEERASNRMKHALGIHVDAQGLLCTHARRVFDALHERHTAVSAKRAAAGRSGAAAKWGQRPPPTWQMPSTGWQMPSGMANATPAPSSAPLSSALERPDLCANEGRSSAGAAVGKLHAGIDAQVEASLRYWRMTQSKRMLLEACEEWARQKKHVADYHATCHRIAMHPNVMPALVEIAIARASTTEDPCPKPLGYVINALGVSKRARAALKPYLGDMPVIERWAELEAKVADGRRAHEAVRALELRITREDQQQGVKCG
jgi:hypothetical protein